MDLCVSYHPISPEQMKAWYFDVFNDLGAAESLELRIPEKQLKDNTLEEVEAFYREKYLDMVKRSRDLDYENFNRWHGYFLAIVQGFFEQYYFVYGSSVSSIYDSEFKNTYFTPWEEVVPSEFIEDLYATSKINGPFSAGAYMSPEQVKQLLNDYEKDPEIKDILDSQFEKRRIDAFLGALKHAAANDQGIIEATKVIDQSQEVFEEPSCYSNVFNCDVLSSAIYTAELAEQYEEIYKGLGD
jgi:methionine synthase II (cobalamin-independent)